MIKKIVLAAMVAASLGGIATSVTAANVIVQVAPPALRAEVMPPPRRGYVWVAGHWEWRNRHHQWVAGTWIRERRGYMYNQPAWVWSAVPQKGVPIVMTWRRRGAISLPNSRA